jgi:putative NADH-flavin reductase
MKLLLLFIIYAIVLSAGLALRGLRARKPPTAAAAAGGAPRRRPERLLIVGATGGTGRQLVAQALERGRVVTALVRNPSKLQMEHPRLTVVQGDVLDYASVEGAVLGQEAVVCALGHKKFFSRTRILSEGTRNLLRAMAAHGVPRLVCESSLGIGDSAGRMGLYYTLFVIPVILPLYFWDKTRQERLIAASTAEWVIVRPAVLTNGAKRGTCRHGPDAGGFVWTPRISRADVADFMLTQTTQDTYVGTAAGVCC